MSFIDGDVESRVFLPGRWPALVDLVRPNAIGVEVRRARPVISAAGIPRYKVPVWLLYTHMRPDQLTEPSSLATAAMKIIEDALVMEKKIPDSTGRWICGFSHRFLQGWPVGIQLTIVPHAMMVDHWRESGIGQDPTGAVQ